MVGVKTPSENNRARVLIRGRTLPVKVASFIPGSFEGVPRETVYLERFEKQAQIGRPRTQVAR